MKAKPVSTTIFPSLPMALLMPNGKGQNQKSKADELIKICINGDWAENGLALDFGLCGALGFFIFG